MTRSGIGPVVCALLALGGAHAVVASHAEAQTTDRRLLQTRTLSVRSTSSAQAIQARLQSRPVTLADADAIKALSLELTPLTLARSVQSWQVLEPVAVAYADTLQVAEELELDFLPEGDWADYKVYRLPETRITAADHGGSHSLEVFLRPRDLRYDPQTRSFVGQVDIWSQDPLEPGEDGALENPIPMQLLADVEAVEPDPARLERVGIPATSIRLRDANVVDSLAVLVLTDLEPEGYPLWIKVQPVVDIRTSSDTIQAWGVESMDVTVSVRGSSGVDDTEITLLADEGDFQNSAAVLSSDQPVRARLRSGGPGDDRIQVDGGALGDLEHTVHYAFPTRFFLAAAIGGLIGMFLSGGPGTSGAGGAGAGGDDGDGGAPAAPRTNFRDRLRVVLKGLVAGLVAAAAYLVLGLNVLPLELPNRPVYNEGLVFLVATFGAMAWTKGALVFQKFGS